MLGPEISEIERVLKTGEPVVIEGPGPGWCVQAVGGVGEPVRIEVLNPAYWGNGPEIPDEHQDFVEAQGLQRESAFWLVEKAGDGAVGEAAQLMWRIIDGTWGNSSS